MAEYHNPQHEPGSERRLLYVFLVMFIAMLAFQPLFKKYLSQPPAPQTLNQPQPKRAIPTPSPAAATPPPVPVGVSKQAASETETVIENDLYRITFTNRGAQVKSWILKKFDNDAQNGPLDLVNNAASQKYGYPLSLWTYDEALRNRVNSVLYAPSTSPQSGINEVRGTNVTVIPAKVQQDSETLSAPASITFEYSDQGLSVRKTFHFDHTYLLKVETAVTYKGAEVTAFPAWPSGFGDQVTPASYAAGRIDYHNDESTDRTALMFPNYVLRLPVKNISGGNTIRGPFEWGAAADQYFAAVFIPDDPNAAAMATFRSSLPIPREPDKPESKETINVEVIGAAVGSLHGPTIERMYVGPKELAVLESVIVPTIRNDHRDLRGLVNFGWWGIIAKPLFLWLRWTYFHIVPNWGWAIILQTFVITVALLPLRISQMKSMLKMQRIAPQIKSIQDKYKKYSLRDPRKAAMNEEISALYKKEGVNPVGGCLPLLIQLPFLYAYYKMLEVALDLRHAHWLWIHDLSSPEAGLVRVLPIAMVITMLITQKMTPQAGMDPAQQRMMTVMMPLMMGFIFWNLAAGLNLYYTISNLISIAQQAVMNRTKLGREMREMMAKRARKKDK